MTQDIPSNYLPFFLNWHHQDDTITQTQTEPATKLLSEPQTFKEITQAYIDEINHQLEEENINPAIKTSVEDIHEMLDAIVEFL
ncbi:MAG: hypothetical protein ACKPEN_22680 [Planktothrix sp.]|uniref:hypothetical protein n=1 Tax=Planktothrix sp. TaxID=3088171 RepID=UPI0038D3C440